MAWRQGENGEIGCIEDTRLARIESKLDEVGTAVVALARMEEKMITLFKRMDNYDQGHTDVAERLTKMEMRVGSNGQMLRFAERIFWIVLSAGVGYLFWSLRG